MEARFALYRATGDLLHLAEAYRMLHHILDHAPTAMRAQMVERVPLQRAISEAWDEKDHS